MNIFFICRASPPVWVLGPLCTIDTTGGISYSTAYTDMRYEICDACGLRSDCVCCVVRFVCENVGWEDGGMVPSSHGTTYRQQLLTCIVSSNYLTIRPD